MTEDLETKRKRETLDRLIYPPVIMGPDTVILSPPLGSVEEYMQYLRDNKEHYRAFFGLGPDDPEYDE